jgi:hypothetical protein
MKDTLLFVLFLAICSATNAQIPNGNFENWTAHNFDHPVGWDLSSGINIKTTDKHNGSLAIHLQGDTVKNPSTIGYISIGNSNNGIQYYGGVPFAGKPDSIIFWCKYSIAAGDSALIYIHLKKNGLTLAAKWYKFAGSSPSNYKRIAIKLDTTKGRQNADSLIIAFSSSNVFKKLNPSSWINIDDVSFAGTSANIPNPGFENWQVHSYLTLDGWLNYYSDANFINGDPQTLVQTTDKANGNFALIVQSTKNSKYNKKGYTRTGSNSAYVKPSFPVPGKFDTLYCLYKWLPQNSDSCIISLGLYRGGGSMAGGSYVSGVAQNNWTILKIPMKYITTDIPDSASIALSSYFNNPKGSSILYIDNMSLSPVYGVGTDPITQKAVLIVYPNPASDKLHLVLPQGKRLFHAQILNMKGACIKTVMIDEELNVIDISDLAAGVYSISLMENAVCVSFVKK